MNTKYINYLFFFIILFLIFNNTPKLTQMNFVGGVLGSKLVFYPIVFGMIYTLYCQYRYKNVLVNFYKFLKFIAIYFTIIFISLIIGLYTYPYYDLVLNGPVTQIEKLPKLINILNSLEIYIDEKTLIALWMITRTIKRVLFEGLYTFGGAYMIYCWYHNNWRTVFDILIKALLASLVIIFGYCFIELSYLAGNETAKNILTIITPYLHDIKSSYGWWPPLLLPGQLRSIFAEPSYYGIYFAFALPFLWYVFISVNERYYKIISFSAIIFFTFCLFLTQARTAVVLFCGEVFILSIFTVYFRNKFIFKAVCKIFIAIVIAFMLSGLFINNLLVDNRYGINSVESYVESNLTSLTSTSQRSNGARYSIMIADLKIALDHPSIGVGSGLRNAYIPDYLPEMAKDNGEVKMWIQNQKEKGILRSGFPKLGEYPSRFAETGIIGLALFLVPPFILLRKLYFKITDKGITVEDKLPYVFFTISLIGIMASRLGDTINITYCYWVLLGLGYAMCFGKEYDVKDNGDTGSRQEH